MEILIHTAVSAARILAAVAFSLPLAVLFGLAAENHKPIGLMLRIMLSVPKYAFMPLTIILFGIGESARLILLCTSLVPQLAAAAASCCEKCGFDTYFRYRHAGMSALMCIMKLRLPEIFPELLSAVGTSAASSVSVLMLAESFGTRIGLGFFVTDRLIKTDFSSVVIAAIFAAATGSAISFCFSNFSKKIIKQAGKI